jgi:hypothetical protein
MSYVRTHINHGTTPKLCPRIPLYQTSHLISLARAENFTARTKFIIRGGSLATFSYTDVSPSLPRAIEYPTSLGFVESDHFLQRIHYIRLAFDRNFSLEINKSC